MKNPIFTGAAVAIITPMNEDGTVNYDEFAKFIDFQIENGTCKNRIFHNDYLLNKFITNILVKVTFCCKKLTEKNGTACCTTKCVVRKANKFIIVLCVFSESADRNSHTVFKRSF